MNEYFCDYKTSLGLKDLGYDEPCNRYYHITDDDEYNENSIEATEFMDFDFVNSKNKYRVGAPSLFNAMLWLAQLNDTVIRITPELKYGEKREIVYYVEVVYWTDATYHNSYVMEDDYTVKQFENYIDALRAGIDEAITIIKK